MSFLLLLLLGLATQSRQEVAAGGEMNQTPVERALEILERIEPPPTRKKAFRCPNPDHEDKRPSAMRYPDGGWKCHSCGSWGDALDLYALRQGLTIRQALDRLRCFEGYQPKKKEMAQPVPLTFKQLNRLLISEAFLVHWEAAKTLAVLEPMQAKADLIASWDYLTSKSINIPEVFKLASLIRGTALFRHAKPAKAHKASERTRAVRQLLRELEMA